MDAQALGGDSSDSSSAASSSSSDTVLIAKPLNQKHRKQLQAQLRAEDSASERASASAAAAPVAAAAHKHAADLLCLACERDGGADMLLCSGPCVSAFHAACLGVAAPPPSTAATWKCPSCARNTHACFHCKRAGASVGADDAAAAPSPSPAPAAAAGAEGLRPVRKCRALSCGKFYHSDCIAKLPLARIAGAHFICPLHTCAACEQSGAKKESVRCMRCPVAYHTSCLPKNCTRSFPGKRIVCPKHEREVPAKDKTSAKEPKPLKAASHEATERVETATARSGESPVAVEEAKAKAESRSSESKSEAREASSSSSSKKLSKSAKREKKKKKKKRKKSSKRDSKGGRSDNNEDDDEEEGDGAGDGSNARAKTDGSDGDVEDEEGTSNALTEELTLTRVDSFTLPPLSITRPDVVSPATSSSLYESPAAANERIKARLVEALGQSDDDVESIGSPITLPTPKAVRVANEDAPSAGAESSAVSIGQAELAAPVVAVDLEKVKQERISEGEEGGDEKPGGSASPTLRRRASSGTPRASDGADGAKGKASSSSRPSKKKKKKTKSSSHDPVDSVQDSAQTRLDDQDDALYAEEKEANEAKWVQCDSCKKWRTVPKDIDLNAMPERWYCEMNSWDAAFASCSVDEEGADPAAGKKQKSSSHSKKSKGKSKSKAQPSDSAAPLTIVATDGGASSPSSGPGSLTVKTPVVEFAEDPGSGDKSSAAKKQDKQSKKRKLKLKLKEKYREATWVQSGSSSTGSRPSKKAKAGGEATVATPDGAAAAVSSGGLTLAAVSADVPAKPPKPPKTPKGGANPPASSIAYPTASVSAGDSTPGGGGGSTPGGHSAGGGATGGAADPPSSSSSALGGGKSRKAVKPDGIKKTVLEWAQCEKCNKWRKLPQHIKSSTLPDKWYCSMNHWDVVRASCSVPEEADQEPLSASPLPSAQTYYPMPGHFGSHSNGVRSKRSKLSYSDLLYAGTGQLRKTYTSESSTLTFEHGGRVYHRDDQYKDSSMYVSPHDSLAASMEQTGAPGNGVASSADAADAAASDKPPFASLFSAPNEPSVEQVATLLLDSMDLRRTSTIAEMLRAANDPGAAAQEDVSLSLVTAAVSHLVQQGLIAKQESGGETDTESERTSGAARAGSKRRRSGDASAHALLQFRKVPKRPLKASKCWKLPSFELPLKD